MFRTRQTLARQTGSKGMTAARISASQSGQRQTVAARFSEGSVKPACYKQRRQWRRRRIKRFGLVAA